MHPRNHVRLLAFVSLAWSLFWLAGLPDYYQQYSTRIMVVFDLAILPPIGWVVYRSISAARPGRARQAALWWAFYIVVPLCIYDSIYCGLYLGHGIHYLWRYWYLTVYYVLPWIAIPPMGWWIDRRRRLQQVDSMNPR